MWKGVINMRLLFELLRIILLFTLVGGLSWILIESVYSIRNVVEKYQWLGGVGIYTLLFVWYRNRLQFTGWYKGEGREKLSRKMSLILVLASILLLAAPFLMSTLLD